MIHHPAIAKRQFSDQQNRLELSTIAVIVAAVTFPIREDYKFLLKLLALNTRLDCHTVVSLDA